MISSDLPRWRSGAPKACGHCVTPDFTGRLLQSCSNLIKNRPIRWRKLKSHEIACFYPPEWFTRLCRGIDGRAMEKVQLERVVCVIVLDRRMLAADTYAYASFF